MTALRGLRESHPEMGAEELQRLNNQVLLMIAEYHLTSASQGTHRILPVLPEGAARLMPPLDSYLPGSFDGCRDVRVTNRAQILRVAAWLHRLETESEATPLGGPTGDATAPVRETEQDMETEGHGGNSPVTPNEDDLLTGAGTADVEMGIASLHVDSPAKPRGNGDATT